MTTKQHLIVPRKTSNQLAVVLQNLSWSLLIGLLLLGFVRSVKADELTPAWQLAPNDRPYIGGTNYTERGIAFNPATTNILVVSRAGGLNVMVLDAATGAELRALNVEGITGGTFVLSMIGVSDDGVVYAANLSTSTTVPNFKLYRWANDQADSVPTIAFEGDPAGLDDITGASRNPQRWGDSLDVRGSGANTMVVVPSRATSAVAILTTTDAVTFTSRVVTNAAVGAGSLGVAFGEGNTLWTKLNGQPLRYVSFNLSTGQATLIKEFADPTFPNTITAIGVNPLKKLLSGVAITTPDNFRLYDISNPTASPTLLDQENFPADNANANNVGSVDFGTVRGTNMVFALDSNNGLVAYQIASSPANPPTLLTQPQSQTVLEGAVAVFSVSASGVAPFRYQWQFNDATLVGATNSTFSIANLELTAAGAYKVIVSNAAGSMTSSNAVLTVNRIVRSDVLTPLWRLAPGDRPYINTDNSQRGIAYNPMTGNLLLVSRSVGTNIYVLDGATGKELRQLNTDPAIISGGTFALNMIGVADDGAVYACNLVTDSASGQLAVYRWQNDGANTAPTIAFLGDPSAGNADATNRRFGDSFDVRGAGATTQILLASRNGSIVSILTTADGIHFNPTVINTDAGAGDIGLGVAFGAGNSFWGTAISRTVRLIDFNLAGGIGATRQDIGASDIPLAVVSIAVDPAKGLLAGIALETPDTVRLYDIANLPAAAVLVDQELFPTDNTNGNGTGAADFGGGRLYALDSNNGIVAFTVNAKASGAPNPPKLSGALRQGIGTFEFTVAGNAAITCVVQATADFVTWAPVSTNTISAGGTVRITDTAAGSESKRFYRAIVRP